MSDGELTQPAKYKSSDKDPGVSGVIQLVISFILNFNSYDIN